MSTIAVLATIAAWLCALRRPPGILGYAVVFILLLLGMLFTIFGGLAYWWDHSNHSDQANAVVPVCGVLILLSHAHWFVCNLLYTAGRGDLPTALRRRRPGDDRT